MRVIKLGDKYYCVMKQKCTIDSAKEVYMNKAKVTKGSFAAKYTEVIFRNVFCNAVDLKADYNDFYIEEYSNFETFLYQKELLSKQEIIILQIDEGETLMKLDMDANNYNLSDLFEYEDGFIDAFNQMIEGVDE